MFCAVQTRHPRWHTRISTPRHPTTKIRKRTKEEKLKNNQIPLLFAPFFLFLLFVSRIPYSPFLRSSSESAGQTGKRQQQAAQTHARRTEKEKSPCPVLPHVCVCVSVSVSLSLFFRPRTKTDKGRKVLIVLIMCTVRLNAVFICVWGRVPYPPVIGT